MIQPFIQITPWHSESYGKVQTVTADNSLPSNAGSATYPAANLAIAIPFTLIYPYTVRNAFVYVGATRGTDSWAAGVYTVDGTKICASASTLTGTANTIQVVAITATVLGPGRYYIVFGASGNTDAYFRVASAAVRSKNAEIWQDTAAWSSGLKATLVPAAYSQSYIPVFGITSGSVV